MGDTGKHAVSEIDVLIVYQIGYLPHHPRRRYLFFQLVNARYEKGAMILTSNRGFNKWGEAFGDPVVAIALLIAFCTTPSVSRSREPATPARHADLNQAPRG